jgi:nitrite reductase/ring-hydroxylating ferredoxin subunit/uncharacterized membrane protein
MGVVSLLDGVAGAAWLDRVAGPLRTAATAVLRTRGLRDLLHGVPFGHAVHPVLVQVPIGAWTSAALLDLVPGERKAADLLVGAGCAAALPAAVAGWADWSSQRPEQQRVGLVHATGNVVALGLYTASLVARCTGHRAAGRALSYAGYALAGGSAYVGGHLVYRQAAAVDHAAAVPYLAATDWVGVGPLDELPDRRPVARMADRLPVCLYRDGDEVCALADRCSHLAGPLHDGTVADGVVTCPWHGSRFALADGALVGGPATAPQPAFDTRVRDGQVEVRYRG